MASRLAERREQFSWELMAAGTMTAILFFAGSVYKRKDLVIPIAPLIMGVGYRYDAAYGTQSNVLRGSFVGNYRFLSILFFWYISAFFLSKIR